MSWPLGLEPESVGLATASSIACKFAGLPHLDTSISGPPEPSGPLRFAGHAAVGPVDVCNKPKPCHSLDDRAATTANRGFPGPVRPARLRSVIARLTPSTHQVTRHFLNAHGTGPPGRRHRTGPVSPPELTTSVLGGGLGRLGRGAAPVPGQLHQRRKILLGQQHQVCQRHGTGLAQLQVGLVGRGQGILGRDGAFRFCGSEVFCGGNNRDDCGCGACRWR